MSRHEQVQPDNADLWSQDHSDPFPGRTISMFFWIIALGILGVAAVFAWPVSNDSENQEEMSIEKAGMANGIVSEIMESQRDTLAKREQYRAQALGSMDFLARNPVDKPSAAPTMSEKSIGDSKNFNQSFNDIVNADIIDARGNNAGELFDVLVNKETGKARAIILDDDDTYYDKKLAALSFENIKAQQNDGDTLLSVTERNIENRTEFDYAALDNSKYISLKALKNSQVIDDQNKYVGEIDALIYQDTEVQEVYFELKPSLSSTQHPVLIGMPYKTVNLVEGPEGYNVKLSKNDTQKLAKALFQK